MTSQKRLSLLSIAVLLALLAAAAFPLAVLAEDAAPPPPDAPVVEEAPTDPVVEAAPTDPVVVEAPTDPIVVEAPTDPVVLEAPTDPVVVDESLAAALVLEAAPEGTELVVLDAAGEPLPLASEEAAATLLSGDPMWCPEGQAPGGGGCTDPQTSFGDLITVLASESSFSGPGTIFVAYDYDATAAGDAGGDIVFDYANNYLYDLLVVQGGWDGNLDGQGTIVGTSTIDLGTGNWLVFLDWGGYGEGGELILNDINVVNSGGLYIGDEIDTPAANVTLSNVTVSNNDTESKEYCFPTDGCEGLALGAASIWTTGDVTVVNSEFDWNESTGNPGVIAGLQIGADGNVTLRNVSASHNDGDGVDIYGYDEGPGPASVSITNSVFAGNTSAVAGWGVGVYLGPTGNATVRCSAFSDNNIGLWGDGPGSLTSDSNTFSGNGIDTLVNGGTLTEASSGCGGGEDEGKKKPQALAVVPTGVLPIVAVTSPLAESALPGALPEGSTFGYAFTVKLTQGGAEVGSAPGGVLVSIDVPAGMSPPITVLSWDGTQWVEVTSSIVDGKIQFTVTGPGTFVLVPG